MPRSIRFAVWVDVQHDLSDLALPHRGVDDHCGSLEVWFAGGRKSVKFYWDNLVSRRLNHSALKRAQAIEKATALARAEVADRATLTEFSPTT